MLIALLLVAFTGPTSGIAATPPTPQALAQTEASAFEGRFEGTITGPGLGDGLEITVHIEASAETGKIDIPAQGVKGRALVDFEATPDGLRFLIDGIPGEPTFVAQLSEDGETLSGPYTQAGADFRFSLVRIDLQALAAARLEGLDERIENLMDRYAGVGLSLAIVYRGEPVRHQGYGVLDTESKTPVDSKTLFAIGSSSKAFTATTLAALAAEGALDLDESVTDVLPRFRLHDETATHLATPRDLMSHRTGLPRHDLLWYGNPDFELGQLIDKLPHLEPTAELREAWQYNNLMFGVAGLMIEAASGKSWQDAMRERVFAPLGMTSTVCSSAEAAATGTLAQPYERKGRRAKPLEIREIEGIGPAGSLHSNADDLARWLLFNLESGKVDGVQVLEAFALSGLHRPHMPIGGLPPTDNGAPASYGLGWFIDGYRGHVRVHHGGNIDGYSALVTMLPNERLGVAVLVNQNGSALPGLVAQDVFDSMLELERDEDRAQETLDAMQEQDQAMEQSRKAALAERVPDTAPARPLSAYTGLYAHDGYGKIEITQAGDSLQFRLHADTAELEHFHFEVFRVDPKADAEHLQNLALQFRPDLDGLISALDIQLEITVDPIRFELQPDPRLSDPAFLASLTGKYSLMGVQEVEFKVKDDGHLYSIVPGQPHWKMAPLRGTTFDLVDLAGFRTRFNLDETGKAIEAVFKQPNGTFVAERVD